MSDNRYGEGFTRRIREWEDRVEEADGDSMDDARKPFDAGVMLAIATLFEAWDANDRPAFDKAMAELRETVEAVIE